MHDTIRTAFTGQDNQSVDVGRVLWAALVVSQCGMQAVSVVLHGIPFDPVSFVTGGAALLAGGGAALRIKAPTEPVARA